MSELNLRQKEGRDLTDFCLFSFSFKFNLRYFTLFSSTIDSE